MKRLIATIILIAFALMPISTSAQQTPVVNGWNAVVERLTKSVVFIQMNQGSCTGFVINSTAKDKDKGDVDYVITAAHCDGTDLYADQRPAEILAKDIQKDLMVLKVEDLDRPALKLARRNPVIGDEVASYGFGYGFERPMFRVTHISDDKLYIPRDNIGGPLMAVDASFVPGQSGGPVVNADGEVVMIVQLGTQIVGFGVGAEIIRDKTGKYFEKVP